MAETIRGKGVISGIAMGKIMLAGQNLDGYLVNYKPEDKETEQKKAQAAHGAARPVGLINCVEGFSTFTGQPLLNVHDIVVLESCRRQGIAGALLAHVESVARDRGCCKLTLEVLEGNQGARQAYENFGFAAYQLDPAMGRALFMEKKL